MPAGGLRNYLSELSPQARTMLLAEFERRVAAGDHEAAGSAILAELREFAAFEPLDDAAHLFFRPLEPYLVDDRSARRHPGRLARCRLNPLWSWLRRDLLPEAIARYDAEASDALKAGEIGTAEALAQALQDRVAVALRSLFADEDRAESGVLDRIGPPLEIEDVAALRWLLRGRDMLGKLSSALPERIDELTSDHVETALAQIESTARPREIFPYALTCLMHRLVQPVQLVRLAAHAAGSRAASRMAETPYGLTVTMVVCELERMADILASALASSDRAGAADLLRRIDAGLRGLGSEIDIPVASSLGRQLASLAEQAAALGRTALQALGPSRLSA